MNINIRWKTKNEMLPWQLTEVEELKLLKLELKKVYIEIYIYIWQIDESTQQNYKKKPEKSIF